MRALFECAPAIRVTISLRVMNGASIPSFVGNNIDNDSLAVVRCWRDDVVEHHCRAQNPPSASGGHLVISKSGGRSRPVSKDLN